MPQIFKPKKIISDIRSRKFVSELQLEELDRLLADTDNYSHYTEKQKKDLITLNRKTYRTNKYHIELHAKGKKTVLKSGGKIVRDNTDMVLSQNKAIAHHTKELKKAINKKENVDAWVVGKMERASTDISDVTHYLDGKTEYEEGGDVHSKYRVIETDKLGKKKVMGSYDDYDSAEAYAMMKSNFVLKGRSVSIEDNEGVVVRQFEEGGEIPLEPLLDKDGERRIDEKAIKRLELLARELPQTKYMYLDKNGNYLLKRKQLHKQIIDSFKKNKPCITNRQPVAILTGGAPASGKSTFIKKYIDLDPEKVYHVDADEVRAMLPEYKGWNASQTHLETSDIVTRLIDTIGEPCEFDLIYDGTMNRADKYTDLVDKLHAMGYKVFIIYISIPKEVSIERSRERYKKMGRYVPKEVIDKVYESGLTAFEDVAKNMADGYVRIDGMNGDIIEKGGMEMPKNIDYAKGGKIGFEGLSKKVAKNYEGKTVKPEYQKLYGKTYSKEEAKEVGDKVASKVYRQQLAKMELGGQVGDNALVLSANKMGYIVEVGNDAYTLRFPDGTQSVFTESELQIMNDDDYFADGGETNKQWVVYVNNDQNIIGTYNSERLAKRMMEEAWNSGDYESVGVGLKSDAYSDEYYAKGGATSSYNYGRSWHMDKRKFNKSENYELPIGSRKKAMGGDLGNDYEEYEMVVLTKDENGKSHNYRFLVSARDIEDAKRIATEAWQKEFADMGETFYKVMSDSKYRMDYGMADGGVLEEGDYVWNAVGKKLVVNKVTDDEYYLSAFGQIGDSPFSKQKVEMYLKNGEWSREPKMADGGVLDRDSDAEKLANSKKFNAFYNKLGVLSEGYTKNEIARILTGKGYNLDGGLFFEIEKNKKYVKYGEKPYTYDFNKVMLDSGDIEELERYLGNYPKPTIMRWIEKPKSKPRVEDSYGKGGTIKVGDKVRSTIFEGVEGEVVAKKGDMLFIVKKNARDNGDTQHDVVRISEVQKMAKGGATKSPRYNIVDEGRVVETNVTQKGVIDYANTLAFYDLVDESDMGEVYEMSSFDEALNYLGMLEVEVVELAEDGMSLQKKNLYTIENLGKLTDDVEFILEVNSVEFNKKDDSIVAVTTENKIKLVVSDIEDIDDPQAKDIVVRTANKVLHGTYKEPTKKKFTEGMSEKTAERMLRKLGVVGNAPMSAEQKAKKDEKNAMILFTPEIDKKLFEQYKYGADMDKQDVVVKIFNPFGRGTWYVMNADPEDPDYLWGIVDLFDVEMGSMSREELVSLRIPPLGVRLERDLSFKPINAKELFEKLQDGEQFKFGGNIEYKQKDFDNTIQ